MHVSSPTTTPRLARAGALITTAASALGVLLSGYLTILKFRSEYGTSATPLNACQIGWLPSMFDCESALTSPFSQLFGLPLTVYSAALYATALLASIQLPRYGRTEMLRLLLLLANIAAGFSLGMLFVSTWLIGKLCLYCSGMYLCAAALFAGAWMRRQAAPPARPHPEAQVRAACTLALVGLVLIVAQALTYRWSSNDPDYGRRPVSPAPATKLVFGADDPEVLLAIVLDPSCGACAAELAALPAFLQRTPQRVQVRLFHFPREASACLLPGVYIPRPDPAAATAGACSLSFAVECIASLPRGTAADGHAALTLAFELRNSDLGPQRRLDAIASLAIQRGLLPEGTRYAGSALEQCVRTRDRGPVARSIADHIGWANKLARGATPIVVVVPFRGGVPDWSLAQVFEGRGERRIAKAIERAAVLAAS